MIDRSNYLLLRAYLDYVLEARQVARLTMLTYRSQLRLFLQWADDVPLAKLPARRPTFPRYLQTVDGNNDGKPLTHAHAEKCCKTAKAFLAWARAEDPMLAKALPLSWLESLKMPRPEGKVKEPQSYTVEDVRRIVALPAVTLKDQRDQAAVALLFLSGMRIGALSTMPIEALDLEGGQVRQWPELGMHTKNSKAATTYLLDIPDLRAIVKRWDALVREQLPSNALWYATLDIQGRLTGATHTGHNRGHKLQQSLVDLCAAAGVSYKSIHKLRHGFTMYALERAATVADLKAISQNLMHASLTITDQIYGVLGSDDVGARITALGQANGSQAPAGAAATDELVDLLMGKMLERLKQDARR